MGRFSKILLLGVVFALAFVVAQPATAQVSTGSISGIVVDQTGASVPGASVVLTNRGTGTQTTATTQDNGAFRFALLPVAVYDLEITKQGFKKLKLTNVAVDANVEHSLGSVKLELGAASATVEVSAAPPIIETAQAQVTNSITSQMIQSFPGVSENEGLDFLALQVPGANSSRDLWFSNANGAAFGVNGLRGRNNDQQVDGQNNNDNSVAGPGLFLANVDFVSEYQITTNNFGPEYGRNSCSVVNIVTRSGTNNWHGTIAGTETNSVLTSLTTEQITFFGLKKPTRFNDEFTGATIGGPIWKDHVFVFGGFDNEIDTSQGVFGTGLLTPTNSPDSATGLPAGIATMAGCYPGSANVALLSTIGPYGIGGGGPVPEPGSVGAVFLDNPPVSNSTDPATGQPACQVAMGGVQRVLGNGFHQYDWIYRTDVVVSDSDRFSGRYIFQRQNFFNVEPGGGGGAAGYVFNEPSLSQDFLADWTHTFSGRTLNEVRLSFGRLNVEFGGNNIGNTVPKAGDLASALARISFVDTSLLGFGPATNLPQQRIVNTYQAQDNFSHTMGRHQLKAGANFTYQRSPNTFLPLLNGQFIFDDWAGYASNTPSAVNVANGSPTLDFREYDTFLYGGDDWKIKDNLTLNLGLTWSYYGQPANLFHGITTKRESNPATAFWLASVPLADRTFPSIPTVKNSFGPSVGFAWTPGGGWLTGNGKTVIRGGYRLTYDPPYYNIYLNISTSAPQVFLQSLPLPGGPTPTMPANPTGPNVRGALSNFLALGVFDPRNFSRTTITPNFGPDRVHSWTFGIQREIAKNAVFEARYVGNHGFDLFQSINANPRISLLAAKFPSLIPSGVTPCPAANAVVPNATGRVNCGFGITRERTNTAYSDYNALQTEFRSTNLFNQLTLRTGYTFSKTTDNASEIFGTFGGGGTIAFAQNMLDFKKGEHSLSGLDVTNNWSLSFTEEIPYKRSQHGVIGHILGGWAFAGSYLWTTGQPYTPVQFFMNRATGGVANDTRFNRAFNSNSDTTRPFVANPSVAVDKFGIMAGDICTFTGGPAPAPPATPDPACGLGATTLIDFAQWFNISGNEVPVSKNAVHFIINGGTSDAAFGTPFGNAARNSLRDAIVNTGSFSLFKYINFGERVKLRWHMTMRNVFNHPNFSSIDPFIEDAGLKADFTGFGHPEFTPSGIGLAGSGPGRQIYFGLKVIF